MDKGDKFGKVKAVRFIRTVTSSGGRRYAIWMFKCKHSRCNTLFEARADNVASGNTKSCGCRHKTKGGYSGTHPAERKTFRHMHERCNGTNEDYKDVWICKGWCDTLEGLEAFLKDIGPRPDKKSSIDRIDNDGGYTCGHCKQCTKNGWKSNCRWATKTTQSRNRSNVHWITYKGQKKTSVEWAQVTGIKASTIRDRYVRYGWSAKKTLTTPTAKKTKR